MGRHSQEPSCDAILNLPLVVILGTSFVVLLTPVFISLMLSLIFSLSSLEASTRSSYS